jgi:hypothetical protein
MIGGDLMNRIMRIILFCVALFAMLSVGCSDEKKETQNLPQTEQSAPPKGKFVMSEESKNRLRERALKQIEERERIKKLNPQTEVMEDTKEPPRIQTLHSVDECYRACYAAKILDQEGDSLDEKNVRMHMKVRILADECEKSCRPFENIIPVNACGMACLAAGDEFILRSNYIMDSTTFARFVLEICDETCPCANRFDSLSYKKEIRRILDSLMRREEMDSVVYAKFNKAIKRVKCRRGFNRNKHCPETLIEYDKKRAMALENCSQQ